MDWSVLSGGASSSIFSRWGHFFLLFFGLRVFDEVRLFDRSILGFVILFSILFDHGSPSGIAGFFCGPSLWFALHCLASFFLGLDQGIYPLWPQMADRFIFITIISFFPPSSLLLVFFSVMFLSLSSSRPCVGVY